MLQPSENNNSHIYETLKLDLIKNLANKKDFIGALFPSNFN